MPAFAGMTAELRTPICVELCSVMNRFHSLIDSLASVHCQFHGPRRCEYTPSRIHRPQVCLLTDRTASSGWLRPWWAVPTLHSPNLALVLVDVDSRIAGWLEDSARSLQEASHGPHDPRGFKENRHADHYESGRNNEQHHKARPFHIRLPDAVRRRQKNIALGRFSDHRTAVNKGIDGVQNNQLRMKRFVDFGDQPPLPTPLESSPIVKTYSSSLSCHTTSRSGAKF